VGQLAVLPVRRSDLGEHRNMKNRATEKRVQKLLQRLAENPDDTEARLDLGKVYFLNSQFDDAVKCYEALLELDPTNVSAYYNLGVAFLALKKTSEAKVAFESVLGLDPNNEAAQKELAKLVSFP
jgi:cytochrome c-type biogenesis protein CcmH/NrfG